MAIVIAGTIGHGDCYCWDHRPWRWDHRPWGVVFAGTIGHGGLFLLRP